MVKEFTNDTPLRIYIYGFWNEFTYTELIGFPLFGLLDSYVPVKIITNPNDEFDIGFCGVFSKRPPFLKNKFCIQWISEPSRVPNRWGDYQVGFLPDDDSHLYFPNWQSSLIDYNFTSKSFVIHDQPRPLIKKDKYCAIFASHDSGSTRKRLWNIMESIAPIDSYGSWNNNCSSDKKRWNTSDQTRGKSKMAILDRYKYSICTENCIENYYLTEKLPEAMLSNTIPVYIGDPMIEESCINIKRMINATYLSDSEIKEAILKIDPLKMIKEPPFIRPWFKNGIQERSEKLLSRIYEEI